MKLKKIFLITILLIFIPFLIVSLITKKDDKELFKLGKNEDLIIRVKRADGNIETIRFEDYIVGVLAGEVPTSFEMEALKAQAVAARSYALSKMEYTKNEEYDVVDNVNNQMYFSLEELKEKWQDSYQNRIEKIKEAVTETSHEYLEYDGQVVEAFFFSTSVGKTENSEEVFSEALPYLRSVESSWDKEVSPVFNDTVEYSSLDFYTILNLPYSDKLDYEILETTSTGRIKKIKINNTEFKGTDVAKLLNLRSNYFELKQIGNNIQITTTGYGHGVGMSQYGANGMAKEGYTYEQILTYYYTGTKIKKIK